MYFFLDLVYYIYILVKWFNHRKIKDIIMAKIKVIKIDAHAFDVEEIIIENNLESYYKEIGCELVDRVAYDYNNDIVLDDEGLLKGETHFFSIDGNMYAGNALIMSVNNKGEWDNHSVDINEIKEKISFYKAFRENDFLLTFKIPKVGYFLKNKNK
jgi:hypothetical protein